MSIMDRLKGMPSKYVMAVAVVAVVCLISAYSGVWSTGSVEYAFRIYPAEQAPSAKEGKLERTLEAASMGNKTIIISVLNKAYTDEGGMFDLFLRSFRVGINTSSFLDHIVFLAVDGTSYARCVSMHLHCYDLATDGEDFSDEMLYMSKSYLNMLWKKTYFLIQVLKRGYSFLFTDMDIMWLRNPFESLNRGDDDFQFMCDRYVGRPYSTSNVANIGLYFVASNNRTIALFETLFGKRNARRGTKQQDILKGMKERGVFRDLGLRVRYLDVRSFAGFCSNSGNFDGVRIVHANCCRGIGAKFADLSLVLDEWEAYKTGAKVEGFRWPRHRKCSDSWKTKVVA